MNPTGDDITENDLDIEFRQVLYIIRPYITHINSNYHLEKYRVWLERLNNSNKVEKFERNQYLIELANQIHDNDLKPPFTFDPPKGLLPRLGYCQTENLKQAGWPYVSSPRQSEDVSSITSRRSKKRLKAKSVARPFQKIGKSSDDVKKGSETSSWCDLSESATSLKLGGGDTDEDEGKIILKKDLKINGSEKEEEELAENNDRKPTQEEVEALKQRMKDLLEVKNALRDTHCLTEDRKKTIDKLQNKLQGVEQQNSELIKVLEEQNKKFLELEKIKSKELSDFKEKFSILRQKEIEFLKKQHKEEIEEIMKKHSSTFVQSEIEQKIEIVKGQYEEKIKEINESSATILKEKDEKILWLQEELKTKQLTEKTGQSNEQIICLKKCISKLDKVLHKNEKDYIRKIEKLKQELEMKDMATQVDYALILHSINYRCDKVQLQTQRADLVMRTSAAKHEEVKNALNNLENKYKKMMENLKLQASETKKVDEDIIQNLQSLLKKHDILF